MKAGLVRRKGRGAGGKENPRRSNYAIGHVGLNPRTLIRGSSRRITTMRGGSTNIRVINRRDYFENDLRCLGGEEEKRKENSCS